MKELAEILLIAAIGHGIGQRTRLPVLPFLMLGGFILSRFSGALETGFILNILELGLVFLVFVAGSELDPARFDRYGSAVFRIAFGQFAALGLGGFLVAQALQTDILDAIYIGLAMATSSTLVVLRQLRPTQRISEPMGRMLVGVLLFQDLLVILGIIIISRFGGSHWDMIQGLLSGIALIGAAYLLKKYLLPLVLLRLKPGEEEALLTTLAVLFLFIALAHFLKLPIVTGAFLCGCAFAQFPLASLTRTRLASLTDFFSALFFTALGAAIQLPGINVLFEVTCFVLMLLVVTPLVVTFLAETQGFTSRAAIESGLLLAQTSEFSLVVGLTGLAMGHIDQSTFSIITLVTVVSMTLTPYLSGDQATNFLVHWHPVRRRLRGTSDLKKHVLILGFGEGGRWVVKPFTDRGIQVLVVDDDPVVVAQLRKMNIPCMHGDGSDEKVLSKAGALQARLVIVSLRRITEVEKVQRHIAGRVPVVARVFGQAEARKVIAGGGVPVENSAAAAETFMAWYEKVFKTQKN